MIIRIAHRELLPAIVLAAAVTSAGAADQVSGTLSVAGKPYALTHGYALADRDDDVRVILCDGAVPLGSVEADFARRDLAEKGKAHCVENTLSTAGKVTSTTLLHDAFQLFPSAVSSWMIFEPGPKAPGRIRGRIHTTQEQMSFEKIPYTWDVTFDLAVAPEKP